MTNNSIEVARQEFLKNVLQALETELNQADEATLLLVLKHFSGRLTNQMRNQLRMGHQAFKYAGTVRSTQSSLEEKLAKLREKGLGYALRVDTFPGREDGSHEVYLLNFPEGLKVKAYRELFQKYKLKMLDPLSLMDFLGDETLKVRKEWMCSLWHHDGKVYSAVFNPNTQCLSLALADGTVRKDLWYICAPVE